MSETPACPERDSGLTDAIIELTIELGRTLLDFQSSTDLQAGALVLLEQFPDDPVAIYAGERLIGRGEVVIVDGQVGVRISELFQSQLDQF